MSPIQSITKAPGFEVVILLWPEYVSRELDWGDICVRPKQKMRCYFEELIKCFL